MIAVPGESTNRPATGGIITHEGERQKLCLFQMHNLREPVSQILSPISPPVREKNNTAMPLLKS